ncbi:MAG TPA: tetratricopeptide repeat protein [Candidatus Dormibacteraeota bacterium]|nr:tetratricopeptide repeat protein [Candidatus Dormibacteraeota bacterium]
MTLKDRESHGEITGLLISWRRGDRDAFDRLFPIVYDQLRILARRQLRRAGGDRALTTTTLIHEAYLKFVAGWARPRPPRARRWSSTASSNYDEAESLLRRALAIVSALRGEDHPDTAGVVAQLGVLEQQRGRPEAAEGLVKKELAVREKVLGPGHPATAASRIALGVVMRERGILDDAADLGRIALEAERKAYPGVHPDVALAAMELGRTEAARRHLKEALPLLTEALGARRTIYGEESWKTAEAKLYLAEACAADGRPGAARPLLTSAAATLHRQRGPACCLTREADDALRRLRAA